ncbi:hypothetical protein DIPPA_00517 [Diplonema papillatum]|nr:hypothetical protein DIPPA_00517 [Diplonema papillatum]
MYGGGYGGIGGGYGGMGGGMGGYGMSSGYGGMGTGGMGGYNRFGMNSNPMGNMNNGGIANNANGGQVANANSNFSQPISRAQIILSAGQEITQAFVSLVEVSIQFAILALSAMCTYAQVQQVGTGPAGESLFSNLFGSQTATTVSSGTPAASAKAAQGSSSWLSKNTRRQVLTVMLAVGIYYGASKLLSRLSKLVSPAPARQSTRQIPRRDQKWEMSDEEDSLVDRSDSHREDSYVGDSYAVALYPYTAHNDDELSFNQNDKLKVHDHSGAWWHVSCVDNPGLSGLVPSNRLQFINKNKI